MADKKEKLLLQVCCAACASYTSMESQKNDHDVIMFYYNPNFNHLEYHFRLKGIEKLAEKKKIKLIVPGYDQEEYFSLVAPFQNEDSIKFISDKERLKRKSREIAITLILETLAGYAKKNKIKNITTSMLCSPYRDHNTIWDLGFQIAAKNKLNFYYQDFRKGYWMGRNIARNYKMAIPAYCSDYLE
jgi:hypothetical protein